MLSLPKTNDTIEVGAWKRLPTSSVNLHKIKRDLTLPNPAYAKATEMGVQPKCSAFFELYEERGGHILVPRHYEDTGMERLTFNISDDAPFTATSTPRNKLQVEAIKWLGKKLDGRLMLRAGAGKTVVSLMSAAEARLSPVLVIVHETTTLEQWVSRITEHTSLTREEIGVVQGSRADFQGKSIAVAMMHTLALRDGWDELKDWIRGGVVIYDEMDVFPAERMRRCLSMFESVRWGLSATYRNDGLQKILELHLGSREFYRAGYELNPVVVSCRIKVPDYFAKYSNLSRMLTEMEVRCEPYRGALKDLVRDSMAKDRKTLLLMQRVEAIESLGQWAEEEGYCSGVIHGGIKQAQRMEVLNERKLIIANRKVAARALDQRDISTVILTPTSDPGLAEQIAGRSLRIAEGKKRPIVVIVWPYHDRPGQGLSMMRNMARKTELALRACGFNEVKYIAR